MPDGPNARIQRSEVLRDIRNDREVRERRAAPMKPAIEP